MRAAVVFRFALALALAAGCGHDAKPAVQPDDHPPLPPGTPIGYLIDDATELQLRDDQVAKLKEIDDRPRRPPRRPGREATPPRAGFLGSGHRRPASWWWAPRRRDAARRCRWRKRQRGDQAPASSAGTATAASGKTEERADDVRAALAQAFTVLDPVQQPIAKRVLSDHGVDVDAGRPEPGHSEPDEPDEPDTGSGSGSGAS